MSLIKKINEDRDAELLAESEARLAEERSKRDRASQLVVVVSDALKTVSAELEEDLEPLGESVNMPKFYRMGDVVLAIQLFSKNRDGLPDPSRPSLALVEYYAALVGVDRRSGNTQMFRVGMLKWLDYQGLYKALTTAPSYLRFDADEVLATLRSKGDLPEA